MPYTRRRRVYKKKRPAKSTYVRKVARQEAKKAFRQQAENKIYDSRLLPFQIDYSGTNAVFNLTYNPTTTSFITQGTDDVQYIGKRIKPIFLTIRGQIFLADTTNVMRCIIVQVKGTFVPTLSTMLEEVGSTFAPYSPFERQYNECYRVIVDRTYSLDTACNVEKLFKIKIPGSKLRHIQFRDNSGALESGGIYMCWISDSGTVAHPTMTYYSRLTFEDA